MMLIDGFCHRCGKPVGKVSWDASDFVFHRKCAKAEDVYTPPGRSQYRGPKWSMIR